MIDIMDHRINTELRQGSVLTDDCAITVGILAPGDTGNKKAVIISHDCDLPNRSENYVEYIVGDIVEKPDGQYTNARHVRRLHIGFQNGGFLSLNSSDKSRIEKSDKLMGYSPDPVLILSEANKTTLKHWLAARYARPAYPDKFEERLSRDLEKKIANTLKDVSERIIGIYFDLGEYRHIDLPDEEPYPLRIFVIYDSLEGAKEASEEATKLASEIEAHFIGAYGKPSTATLIALESCKAVAEIMFTIADLRRSDQWRVEYISYKQGNIDAVVTMGE
jgi:hypothetical protein